MNKNNPTWKIVLCVSLVALTALMSCIRCSENIGDEDKVFLAEPFHSWFGNIKSYPVATTTGKQDSLKASFRQEFTNYFSNGNCGQFVGEERTLHYQGDSLSLVFSVGVRSEKIHFSVRGSAFASYDEYTEASVDFTMEGSKNVTAGGYYSAVTSAGSSSYDYKDFKLTTLPSYTLEDKSYKDVLVFAFGITDGVSFMPDSLWIYPKQGVLGYTTNDGKRWILK